MDELYQHKLQMLIVVGILGEVNCYYSLSVFVTIEKKHFVFSRKREEVKARRLQIEKRVGTDKASMGIAAKIHFGLIFKKWVS